MYKNGNIIGIGTARGIPGGTDRLLDTEWSSILFCIFSRQRSTHSGSKRKEHRILTNKNINSPSTDFCHFSQRTRDCTRSTLHTEGSQATQHTPPGARGETHTTPAHDRRRTASPFAPLESSFGVHKMRCQNSSDIISKSSRVAIYHTIKLFFVHHKN